VRASLAPGEYRWNVLNARRYAVLNVTRIVSAAGSHVVDTCFVVIATCFFALTAPSCNPAKHAIEMFAVNAWKSALNAVEVTARNVCAPVRAVMFPFVVIATWHISSDV
jgi:hypothetical protein